MLIQIEVNEEAGQAFLQWLQSWSECRGNILYADLTDVATIMKQTNLTLQEPSMCINSVKGV